MKGFLDRHLFTSTEALEEYFPEHFASLKALFKLEDEGAGLEVPAADMPVEYQLPLLQIPLDIMEGQGFESLSNVKKMEGELRKCNIRAAKSFEWNTGNKIALLFHPKFLAYLKKRNPQTFNQELYTQTMANACEIRNQLTHRSLLTTGYIYEAADTALQVLQTLGNGPSSHQKLLRRLQEGLKRWSVWSQDNKEQSLSELRLIYADIDDRRKKGLISSKMALGEKKHWGERTLSRRREDRVEMGKKLLEHMKQSSGEPTELEYPSFRTPLRLTEPLQLSSSTGLGESSEGVTKSGGKVTEAGANVEATKSDEGVNKSSIEVKPLAEISGNHKRKYDQSSMAACDERETKKHKDLQAEDSELMQQQPRKLFMPVCRFYVPLKAKPAATNEK